MSQVVHQARAYPGFCGMKQLRVRVDDGETQRIAGTQELNALVTIIYLVGERHCESTPQFLWLGLKPLNRESCLLTIQVASLHDYSRHFVLFQIML